MGIITNFNNLLSKGDYIGAADMLGTMSFNNEQDKRRAKDYAIALRRQGRIANSIMSAAGENRDAVAFKMAMESHNTLPGSIEEPNQYSQKYRELVQNLGGKDSDWIDIQFEGKTEKKYGLFGIDFLAADVEHEEDAFSLFCHQNGYSRESFMNNPDDYQLVENDGKTYLKVRKGSKSFLDIIQGLRNVDENHSIKQGELDPYERGNARYAIKGLKRTANGFESVTGAGDDTFDYHLRLTRSERYNDFSNGYQNPDYTESGNTLIGKSNGISELHEFINDVYSKADEALPQYSDESKPVLTDAIVSDFMTASEADAYALLRQGIGTTAEYKTAREMLKMQLEENLISTGLQDYRVYATELGDEGGVMKELDTADRTSEKAFLEAAKEKGLLTFKAAIVGNKVGTMVYVSAEMDEKHKIKGKGRTYFIENWRNDDAERLFNRDTKTRAVLEYNAMKMYGYDADVDDGHISMATDGTAMFTDRDGNTEQISSEKAQWYLNKQYFLDDSIEQAQGMYFNEDGSLRETIPNIKNYVSAMSLTAMTELYPQAAAELQSPDNAVKTNAENFLQSKANDATVYILKAIGLYKEE